MIQNVGIYFVPFILTVTAFLLLVSKKDLFTEFMKGAREGLENCIQLLPVLVILVTAVSMFSGSGAMEAVCTYLAKLFGNTSFPKEMFPLLIIRPLSGSASNATINEIYQNYGADSFAGRCASVMMGASDTIIYTLAMYFGCVGITKTRHAYPSAFLTFIFCVVVSYILTRMFF